MPVTQELLNKIAEYEKQGYGPDEIVQGLSQSQNFPDIAQKAKEHAANGYSPDEILKGMKSSPVAPSVNKDVPNPEIAGMSPEQLNAIPSFIKSHQGPTEIGTPQVPEWKQIAIQGINKLPEIGQAVGTAGGMAATIGSEGAAAPLIPAGGAAGRVAGRALQTPLTQLLLPKSNPDYVTPQELLKQGAAGATGAALDAIVPALGSKFIGKTPSQGLDMLLDNTNPMNAVKGATRGLIGNTPEKLVKSLVKPSTTLTPEEANKLTGDILKYKGYPTDKGWNNINNQISGEGGNLQSLLSEHAGKSVPRADLQSALEEQIASLKAAGAPSSDINIVQGKLEDLTNRFPSEQIPIESSQLAKQRIYKQNEPYYGMNPNDPGIQSEKAIGEKLKTGIETATGDPRIAETNAKLGDLLNMRSAVGRATNRLENNNPIGLGTQVALSTKSIPGKLAAVVNNPTVKSATAKGLYNAREWATPETIIKQEQLSNIGSPTKYLEDLFGIKYEPTITPDKQLPAPQAKLVAPQRRLPAPTSTTGGTAKDYMYATPENVASSPASDIEASKAILSGNATRNSPTMYGTETGPPFTGQEIPWNVGPKEAMKFQGPSAPLPQKMLPAPAIKGTSPGIGITNEDLNVLKNASPSDYRLLKQLLRME